MKKAHVSSLRTVSYDNTFLIIFLDLKTIKPISAEDYSSIVSSMVYYSIFRHFGVPLKNILVFAPKQIREQINALPFLYFEHVYNGPLFNLDFIKKEFISKIQVFQHSFPLSTNEKSFIYVFFQDHANINNFGIKLQLNYAKLFQDFSYITHSQMYFINFSCQSGSVIQYIKTYQTFRNLFYSNSAISKHFSLLYPLYSNRSLDPYFYISFLQKHPIPVDLKKLFKFKTSFQLLFNFFSSSFVSIDQVIQRLNEMQFSRIEKKLEIHSLSDLQEFCSIIKDSTLQSLEEINILSEIFEIFSNMKNGENLLTQLFKQDNLKDLCQFYQSISFNDLTTFTQLLQNMHNYTGSFVPDIKAQYQNIILISISSPILTTFSYPPHSFLTSIPNKSISLSMGSYTTSIIIESLFLNPDPKGLTQNRIEKETQKFSTIYSELNSSYRYVPQPSIYQTNSFQQIPFREKSDKTSIDLNSILSKTKSLSDLQSDLQSSKIITFESGLFEDSNDEEEWSDVLYFNRITYFNGCPMYYHDREDKIFFNKFLKVFEEELKKQDLREISDIPLTDQTYDAQCHVYSLYSKINNYYSILSKTSMRMGLNAFAAYYDYCGKKHWFHIDKCFIKAIDIIRKEEQLPSPY